MKEIRLTLCGLIVCCFYSCYKDLGNYNYLDSNALHVTNLDSLYTIFVGDSLVIDVQVTTADGSDPADTTRYSYQWLTSGLKDENNRILNTVVLSTKRNFSAPLPALTTGQYNVFYVVTDNLTKTQVNSKCVFNVTNFTADGLFILSATESSGRLDMVGIVENKKVLYKDILQKQHSGISLDTMGEPQSLFINTLNELIIGTERASYLFRNGGKNALQWTGDYNFKQWFVVPPRERVSVDALISDTYFNTTRMIANNNFYASNTATSYDILFNRYSATGPTFRVSPFISNSSTVRSLLFNLDEKCFVSHTMRLTYNIEPNYAIRNTIFPTPSGPYEIPRDVSLVTMMPLRFASSDYSTNTVAVLKNHETGKFQYLLFSSTLNLLVPGLEMNATDFENREHVAVDPVYGYLFYNVGSKLYGYDYSINAAKLMADYGDRKITLVSFPKFGTIRLSDSPELIGSVTQLLVATVDKNLAEGENGVLYFYKTFPSFQNIQLMDQMSGFGQIVDVAQAKAE